MVLGMSSSPTTTTDDIIQPRRRFSIAMVCDFFYPRFGGVESHVWSLCYHLIRLGHKVIVITHAYKCPDEYSYGDDDDTTIRQKSKRSGVRYLPGGIKVYYCPFLPMVDEDCLPTFTVTFPLLRWIFIREAIDVVHSHQATSTLANEAVTYAAELGLASVYTDHSLFGFDDVASVILNRVQKVTMSTVGAVICVSHTCRDNFILRTKLPPSTVHVIPNAVDPSKFTPDITKRKNDRITIVVLSRLVYRKGVDLLVGIIPIICSTFPQVDFVIGGDGNKKLDLEEMVERERLQDRVEFLGFVPSGSVRDTLVRGHVFLNCSLTESFCIAILEAASAGLYVVSTNVGGVPEVLPPDMIHLSDPNIHSLVEGLSIALAEKIDSVDPYEFHQRVSEIYSWERVATETEMVYNRVFYKPRLSFLQRLARYKTVGSIAGYVACILAITVHFVVLLVEWWQPIDLIDVVPNMICFEQEKARNKKRQ